MTLQHPDRVRLWLNALPSYTQAHGQLIDSRDGVLEHCVNGAACDVAMQCGADISVEYLANDYFGWTSADRGPVFIVAGRSNSIAATEVASAWFGVDLMGIRVRIDQLPEELRDRIDTCVDRRRSALGVDLNAVIDRVDPEVNGYMIYVLNDMDVSLADLADALRCTLGIDRHRVPGTDEHAAMRKLLGRASDARARADELARDHGPDAMDALTDMWAEHGCDAYGLSEDDADDLGPDEYRALVEQAEAAVSEGEDALAQQSPHPSSPWAQDWQSRVLLGVA